MRRITALVASACVLGMAAGPAPASASIQAYNEPLYTKTAANDAFFWHWVAVNGTDESANTNYTYYLCFFTYRDNVTVESSNGTTGGPGSSNCTGSLRSGPSPSSGDFGGTPFTTNTVLDDGHTYQMCASAFYRWPYLPWKLDAASIGNCAATTIDRTKPAIGVSVDGTANYTNNPVLQVQIDYQDATSPPWAGGGRRGLQLGLRQPGRCVHAGRQPCRALQPRRQPVEPHDVFQLHLQRDGAARRGLERLRDVRRLRGARQPLGDQPARAGDLQQREHLDARLRPRRARPRRAGGDRERRQDVGERWRAGDVQRGRDRRDIRRQRRL
ncbi:MAG TPA: hypothetical protein VNT55_19140 [Baekduia sp.]|nr:hypothetical protein [Baekduia sp.]